MVSSLLGMVILLFSNNDNKTDKTSVGALFISSTTTHLPSFIAVVKTPFFHSKVPGLEPDV